MINFRNLIAGVVIAALQAGPALAQCSPADPGCTPGGAAVPGPEIGIGVAGLLVAGVMVRYLRNRAKR